MNPLVPMHKQIQTGLRIRVSQLARWIDRVNSRVKELSRHPAQHFSTHATSLLLREARARLGDARDYLTEAETSIGIGSEHELKAARLDLLNAEAAAVPVDSVVIPTLRSRTPSDPRYEQLIDRLLRDLNLRDVTALSTHHSFLGGPLAIDHTFGTIPVFVFTPANRSLLTLSLLYHEIGHWVFADVLTSAERIKLADEIRSFAGEKLDSTGQATSEIAADVFAGLVGGYTYTSSFCCFLLGQLSLLATTNRFYPSPEIRVHLSRWASEYAGDPDAKFDDPLFRAWDFFVAQAKREGNPSDSFIDFDAATDFAMQFAEILDARKISLASTHTTKNRSDSRGPLINFQTYPVPAILREACRFRARADSKTYWDWEFHALGQLRLVDA